MKDQLLSVVSRPKVSLALLLAAIIALVAGAIAASGGRAEVRTTRGALETGISFPFVASASGQAIGLARIRAAGSKYAEVRIYWSSIAPHRRPAGFRPKNPASKAYNWTDSDRQIRAVHAAGIQPLLSITSAPVWAEGAGRKSSYRPGSYEPSPSALADFVTAVARRYSGSFKHLPRVRYFAVWNEPNLNTFMSPQTIGGKAFSPGRYRAMLNAAANAIHAVQADNVVIAGETSPFGTAAADRKATRPLTFAEEVLCVSEQAHASKGEITYSYSSDCKTKVKFDVWSQHPYSKGGPSTRAQHGNVSVGNMGDLRQVLAAAVRAGNVESRESVRLWVTEFSWDSKPPDPKGVPIALETRWVSQMLYRMWASGVSLVVWFDLRDEPMSKSLWQPGLYYAGRRGISNDRAKPILRAFRFPFVALPQPSNKKPTVLLWGRTPNSRAASVVIERRSGKVWRRVTKIKANRYGIFRSSIHKPTDTIYLRARLSNNSDHSAAFSLQTPTQTWTGCVWGTC